MARYLIISIFSSLVKTNQGNDPVLNRLILSGALLAQFGQLLLNKNSFENLLKRSLVPAIESIDVGFVIPSSEIFPQVIFTVFRVVPGIALSTTTPRSKST